MNTNNLIYLQKKIMQNNTQRAISISELKIIWGKKDLRIKYQREQSQLKLLKLEKISLLSKMMKKKNVKN